MANHHHYPDQSLRWISSIGTVIVLLCLIEKPISVVAQPNHYMPVDRPNFRPKPHLTTTTTTLTAPSVYSNLHNEDVYDNEAEANAENIYDDDDEDEETEGDFDITSSTGTLSPLKFNHSIATHLQEDQHEYDDEGNSDQEEYDEIKNIKFSETVSANRPPARHPNIDFQNKRPFDVPLTTETPFLPSNAFRNIFSKPAILVGMIGGVTIGMTSAILLIMFIVYRMRKKDEGSYALEEAPRKSPSHAYSRVSSKEFFA